MDLRESQAIELELSHGPGFVTLEESNEVGRREDDTANQEQRCSHEEVISEPLHCNMLGAWHRSAGNGCSRTFTEEDILASWKLGMGGRVGQTRLAAVHGLHRNTA